MQNSKKGLQVQLMSTTHKLDQRFDEKRCSYTQWSEFTYRLLRTEEE